MSLVSTVLVTVLLRFSIVSGSHGVKILDVDVPESVENGTGPVELKCNFKISGAEIISVRWFLDYEEIFTTRPRYRGIIGTIADRDTPRLRRSKLHSTLRLRRVTYDTRGTYTCQVVTNLGRDTKSKRMDVYVPPISFDVSAKISGKPVVLCIARGAMPTPGLRIFSPEGIAFEPLGEEIRNDDTKDSLIVQRVAIREMPREPVVVECELTIPPVYKRVKKIVVDPSELTQPSSGVGDKRWSALFVGALLTLATLAH